jgi:hypothetical protein
MLNGLPAAAPETCVGSLKQRTWRPETRSPQSRSQGLEINRKDLMVPRRSEAIDHRILSDMSSTSR